MGRNKKLEESFDYDEEKSSKSVIVLSSSDDEEGNEDLSLNIVEKAMSRASKTTQKEVVLNESKNSGGIRSLGAIDLSSSSSQDGAAIFDPSGFDGGAAGTSKVADANSMKKNKKEKRKKKKNKDIEIEEKTVDIVMEEEKAETDKVVETVTLMEPSPIEQSDNIVLRKLLRGPRYFDPPNSGWGTCYNCGEEGHTTVNCTSLKRKKPCFVCGSLEHGFKQCTKGQDCFICKQGGHRAKDCPEKFKGGPQTSKICLRCGDTGHDMFSCRNDYSCDDVKEIQCYICKSFGHLCCVNLVDAGRRELSCYKCGQLGHIGLACSRLRGETTAAESPSSCYRCGEEGHFARECTGSAKVGKRSRELSTPGHRFSKEDKNYLGFISAPQDLGKTRKRKKTQFEERGITTPRKSKQRGGWITNDPADFPNRKAKVNSWRSPQFEERGITTPHKSKQRGGWITEDPGDFPNRKAKANSWRSPHFEERGITTPHKSKQIGDWITEDSGDFHHRKAKVNSWRSPATPHEISSLTAGGQISSSWYSQKAPKHYSGSSTSHHRFSASRFGNTSSDGRMRNYNW